MLLTMLGFVANEEKCSGPGTVQIFLGVGMDSDTLGIGEVNIFFTDARLRDIQSLSRAAMSSSGPLRVSVVMTLLGKWVFIAQVL